MDYILAENEYGKYAVPIASQQRPASQSIMRGGVWEPDTIQFIIDNCGDGIVIHAGTFYGDFLPALTKACKRLYAFEPVQDNYEHAVETLNLNFDEWNHVSIFHAGLGAEDGTMPIQYRDKSGHHMGGTSRFIRNNNAEPSQLQETKVMTLDNTVEHSGVSVIQLDVEGYEEEALKGAVQIIKESKPIIILECWSQAMFNSDFFKDEIFSLGYKKAKDLHANTVLIIE